MFSRLWGTGHELSLILCNFWEWSICQHALRLQADLQMIIAMFLRPLKILSSYKKNWPFRLLWQKFYKPLQDKCRWELLLFISQFSLIYLGAAIVYPIFIALTTLFFASLFSLVNWLFLFFGISFYLFCFVYFGGTNDLLPMLHQQPRQAANCLYVLIRWDTGIPLTWW